MTQMLEDGMRALPPAERETIQSRPPDGDGIRTLRKRLEYVGTAAYAAIHGCEPSAAVDAVFGGAGLASGDRFVITTIGIEITVTEADGLPAGFGVVTMAMSWDTVPEPAW